MRKSSLLLMVYFCTTAFFCYSQTDTNGVKDSRIGKLIFIEDYTLKKFGIEQVFSLLKAIDKCNKSTERDMLLKDFQPYYFGLIINARIIKFDDGKVVIISYSTRKPNSFYFAIKCEEKDEIDSCKAVECRLSSDGTVIELLTMFGVDPNGKDGIVLYDSMETGKANDVLRTEGNVFRSSDPIIQRYQKEVNEILTLPRFKN